MTMANKPMIVIVTTREGSGIIEAIPFSFNGHIKGVYCYIDGNEEYHND